MSALIRYAPYILCIVLMVYGLMSLWLTPARQVRIFPRWTWFLLIVLLPILGPLCWIVSGTEKPKPGRSAPPGPKAPDDDPEFLAKLAHEQQLQSWEDDLLEWELKRLQQEKEEMERNQRSSKSGDDQTPRSGAGTDPDAKPASGNDSDGGPREQGDDTAADEDPPSNGPAAT